MDRYPMCWTFQWWVNQIHVQYPKNCQFQTYIFQLQSLNKYHSRLWSLFNKPNWNIQHIHTIRTLNFFLTYKTKATSSEDKVLCSILLYLHLKLSQERESSETYRLSLLSSLLRLPRLEELVSPFPSVSSGQRYTSMGPLVLFSQIWMLDSGSGTSSLVSGGALMAITVCSSRDPILLMSW